jgi:AcrR family transcriptional regulator
MTPAKAKPQQQPHQQRASGLESFDIDAVILPRVKPSRYRILRASGELFARWGYHGTSTRQIATGAGLSQPTLFHHFKSKQAIMEDLLGINYLPPLSLIRKLIDYPASPPARVWAATVLDVLYCTRLGIDLAGTHNDDVLTDPDFARWSEVKDTYAACVAALIAQGVDSGDFADIDPRLSLMMHTGMTKELIRLVGRNGLPKGEDWADAVAEMMVRALASDACSVSQARQDSIEVVAEFAYHADVQPGEVPRIMLSMKKAMGLD